MYYKLNHTSMGIMLTKVKMTNQLIIVTNICVNINHTQLSVILIKRCNMQLGAKLVLCLSFSKGGQTQDQFYGGNIVKFKNRYLEIKNNSENFRFYKIFRL